MMKLKRTERTTKKDLEHKRKDFPYKSRPTFLNNLKNIKKNWKVVKSSPYKSLMMQYKMSKMMFIVIGALVGWRLISMAINSANTTIWGWINSGFLVFIAIWFCFNLNKKLKNLKNHLKYYEDNGIEMQGNYDTSTNVKTEINDLLKKIKEKEAKNETRKNV